MAFSLITFSLIISLSLYSIQSQPSDHSTAQIEWDEEEFEGFPIQHTIEKTTKNEPEIIQKNETLSKTVSNEPKIVIYHPGSYIIEIVSLVFLFLFVVNYYLGKKKNENIALSWAQKYATKGSVFDKSFNLLGVSDRKTEKNGKNDENEDSPFLLREGNNVFKFYATGKRYCIGMLALIELKNRQDLISRIYGLVMGKRDCVSFEVYMNEENMDQVVFAMTRKKNTKNMVKEEVDLGRFGGVIGVPGGGKWVVEELGVVSESKEVAGDLITDYVLEQVFGDKAFEIYGKGFISMHFSDQHGGRHRKVLVFKFALPNANNMTDMSRLIALVPYYIDLIGKYKLSSQARTKTEATRQKVAQELYREFQNARQEVLQKKKTERKKIIEEAEAKLSAELIRKKEAREHARQFKKGMPKTKMTHAH